MKWDSIYLLSVIDRSLIPVSWLAGPQARR